MRKVLRRALELVAEASQRPPATWYTVAVQYVILEWGAVVYELHAPRGTGVQQNRVGWWLS